MFPAVEEKGIWRMSQWLGIISSRVYAAPMRACMPNIFPFQKFFFILKKSGAKDIHSLL
jgi:hypothetical protein